MHTRRHVTPLILLALTACGTDSAGSGEPATTAADSGADGAVVTDTVSESDTVSASDAASELDTVSVSDGVSEPDTVSVPDTAADTVTDTDTAADTDTVTDTVSAADTVDTSDAGSAIADAVGPTSCAESPTWLWDKPLSHTAGDPIKVAAMPDGGVAVVTTVSDKAWLWRMSAVGDEVWNQTLQATTGVRANAIASTPAGTLLVVGQQGSGKTIKGWISELSVKGTVNWDKTVQYAEIFNGATVLSDGPINDVTLAGAAPAPVAPVAISHHPRPGFPDKIQSTVTWFENDGKIAAQDGIYLGGSSRGETIAPWETGVVVAGTNYTYHVDGDIFVVTMQHRLVTTP